MGKTWKMCGRETVKARSGGRARGAGARTRGLRRAFAANEGFGGHFAAKGGCVFSVIPYIKPISAEFCSFISQRRGREGRNGRKSGKRAGKEGETGRKY